MLACEANTRGLGTAVAVLFTAILFSANQAMAICLAQGNLVQGPETFRYAMALAESFSNAKSALSKVTPTDAPKSGTEPFGDLGEMIYQIKSAAEDYKCAAESVAPYIRSNDEAIALSAEAATMTFRQLMGLDERLVGFIKEILDGKVQAGQMGSFAERLAERRIQLDQTWRILLAATTALTHALVQAPPNPADKLSTLRLTGQQRKLLAERLERDFGPQVRSGLKAGQIPLVASAAMLYGFVTNTDWKSSDGK